MRREASPAVPLSTSLRRITTPDVLEASLAEVDLDAMLRQLSGRLDPARQEAFVTAETAARAQVAELAKRLFDDPVYRPLVEWLLDITLRRPVSIWGLGEAGREYVDRREGANSVVWQLLQAVAEGREEPPPIREGTTP